MQHIFVAPLPLEENTVFVHHQLIAAIISCAGQVLDQIILEKMYKVLWFLLEIVTKSMAQYLVSTGLLRKSRRVRFSSVRLL